MLFIGLATFYVGPSLVLVFLGGLAAMILLFALYPFQSVIIIWITFFLSSSLAQVFYPSRQSAPAPTHLFRTCPVDAVHTAHISERHLIIGRMRIFTDSMFDRFTSRGLVRVVSCDARAEVGPGSWSRR
jgi:hypothetical protein